MTKEPNPSRALNDRITRYLSVDRLVLFRNLAYGAAAACLAILIALTQVGAKETSLRLCVYACVLALPLWLLIGAVTEYYILLGPKSFTHFRKLPKSAVPALILMVAQVSLVVAVAGIIYFLIPGAVWLLGGSTLVAGFLQWRFHINLANWLACSEPVKAESESLDA